MDFKHRITRRSSQIRDDRGFVHRLRAGGKRGRSESAANVQAIWEEYRGVVRGFGNPLCHVLISGSCFAFAAFLAIAAFPAISVLEESVWWWLHFLGAGLFVYVGMRNPGWIRRRRDRLAEQLARCDDCVACAYPLNGLAPEPDGCTVCPECGAAWRSGGTDDTR